MNLTVHYTKLFMIQHISSPVHHFYLHSTNHVNQCCHTILKYVVLLLQDIRINRGAICIHLGS